MFSGVDSMAPKKNRVYIGVLKIALILSMWKINLFFKFIKIFLNTIARLYYIRLIACQANYIF